MNNILLKQKEFYNTNITQDYKFRLEALKKLKNAIIEYQDKLNEAIFLDLNKSETECYMTEIGLVLSDINYQIKHLKRNMKRHKVKTPIAQFKGTSFKSYHPYGNVLIISPWNYPILLSLEPLVGAIAAGNTVILKPSEYSINTSNVIKEIINATFKEDYVTVITGESDVASELLNEKWDYIFFTGGTQIGKLVYEKAASNLTPVTLELGGKSPVIVDKSAKIDLTAKRIVFGKFLNSGQTCVAPDYILVDGKVKKELIASLIKWINILYKDSLNNPEYVKIINLKHFNRLLSYLNNEEIIFGGKYDLNKLKIEPTLVNVKDFNTHLMTNEIFGPLLPIYSYNNMSEIYNIITKNKNPLALYLFTTDKNIEKEILANIQFGGGCINDTIIHLATNQLGFGGVGESGIGSYHGNYSFKTFSHERSIIKKSNLIDLPLRYTPFTNLKKKLIKMFLK